MQETPPAPLQGYLKKQGRAGTWKTRFFQQESSKILYFEKDVVCGVIDLAKIVSVVKKDTLLFCIHTNERQFVLAPVNNDASTVDYWVEGITRVVQSAVRKDSPKTVAGGLRSRDTRSASLGTFGAERPNSPSRTPSPAPGAAPNSPPGKNGGVGRSASSGTVPAGVTGALAALGMGSTNSPKTSKKTLLRLPSRLRNSQDVRGDGPSSPESKTGSAPSGSTSAREAMRSSAASATRSGAVAGESLRLSDKQARMGSRARSMEDVNEGEGMVFGVLARLPPAQRENVIQLQKAFLDFRRLVLKTHLTEVHVRGHDEDALLLPEIQRLEAERQALHARLDLVETQVRTAEAEYYKRGAELATGFTEMLGYIKKLSVPLQDVMRRMQELYKSLCDPETFVDPAAAPEVGVLVDKFRSFLPLLEDALVLDKPLAGRQHAMRERRDVLLEQNKRMREQLSEMEDMAAMTALDCNTIRDFSAKAISIAETLQEVHEMSGSLLPWMTVPNSQVHSSLSRYSEVLREETLSLRVFRDPSFLDVLERLAQQQDEGGADADFELAEDGSLAYATPEKMLELIVTGRGAAYGLDFPKIFVTTFRMFMQPIELLEKVVLIYCTVPSDGHPGDRVAEERKLAPCRLRILNLLKKWIHQHKYDFEHPAMMQLVNDFCHSTLKLTGYERVAENLLQMLCSSTFPAPLPCPEPIPLRRRGPNEPLELSDVDPLELARQMTLDDMLLYTSLEPRDFLNCAWSKKEDPNASPSIRAMIQQFNATAEWVAGLVLNAADEVQRVKYIRHFILTASELLKMNNFNSCVKILGSLSGQAIHRLHTWERLQREDLKIFQDLKSLIGQNWAGLRELMATCFSPSIPLISPFLGDLTYIDEMKSRSGKNMLNFRKLTLTAQAIDKVLAHVEVRYWFTEISEVRRWIQHLETTGRLSADAAHAKSLLIQPRIPS